MAPSESNRFPLRVLRGSRIEVLDERDLRRLASGYERVLIDLGTGDGKFVLREARADPQCLAIGIDSAAESMKKSALRSARKPKKGGLENVVFVVAAAEALPSPLRGLADRITINLPWGSLLKILVHPDVRSLSAIVGLARQGACVDMLLNMQVFQDEALRDRLALPAITTEYVDRTICPIFEQCGLTVEDRRMLGPGPLPERTSWGQRLSVGSRRETMQIRARVVSPTAPRSGDGDV